MRIAQRILLSCVILLAAAHVLQAQSASEQAVVHHESSVKYVTTQGAPDCLTSFVERGDPVSGPATFLVRMAADCEVPWHWHTPNETMMVVSGGLSLHTKDGKPVAARHGDYIFLPAKHIHSTKCIGAAPCEFFLSVDAAFDIHYVDKDGNEIPSADALKAATPPKK